MQLKSVETTPNPNSMKLNLDGAFTASATYSMDNCESCPSSIKPLLEIVGVKNIFACKDFVTLNRDPRVDWQPIIERAAAILGKKESVASDTSSDTAREDTIKSQRETAQKEGQVQIFIQTFKGIPIQVKALALTGEKRISLGERFDQAALKAQKESGADFLKERYWADHGVRYGPLAEMAEEVAEELRATFDQQRLDHFDKHRLSLEELELLLKDSDWHKRLSAVQMLSNAEGSVKLLARSLKDENHQVRRLAAAALGTTGSTEAVGPLCHVLLNDQSIGVRRTAGDALSDIGDPAAQPSICLALSDPNKLVRWRAARFLADFGSEEALPFLEKAADDNEFEVRLEIEAAMQRIRGGGQGSGPAWKRIISRE